MLKDLIALKFPLGAREDVNEGKRPFERKAAFGESGGLKTPFVPFKPFKWPEDESFGDIILAASRSLTGPWVGVFERLRTWLAILGVMEERLEEETAAVGV